MGSRTENEVAPVVAHQDGRDADGREELSGELIDLWPHQEDAMIDRAFSAMRNRRRRRHLQVVRDSQETIESLRKRLQEKE